MRFVVCLVAGLAACCPGIAASPGPPTSSAAPTVPTLPTPPPPSTSSAVAPPAPPPATDPVVDKTKALTALAARVEPTVTPVLQALAQAHGGELMKLEFRLKTPESTERKIRKILNAYRKLTVDQVRIDDPLRYTLRVDDDPPGRYVAAAKATLADLEARGHEVQYVKNYWPRDDNYSGINSVLKDASGLYWELQFHTTESFDAQNDTRPFYEEMREVTTPLDRKRALFDLATKRWNEVPIPKGVLEAGVVHPKDQVRERKRP